LITSPFSEFLRSIAPKVAGTLKKPLSAEALCAAVHGAIAHEEPAPVDEEDILELAERDAEVAAYRTPDPALAAIADLIARGAGTPMGLVTIVDSKTQMFVGQVGLPEDLALAGQTPRSWSFCQHAIRAARSLVVDDARDHPFLAATPLVEMNLVRAYAGVPIEVDGKVVGTVCALSDKPHHFEAKELATLSLAARLVSAHLGQRPFAPPPPPPDSDPPVSSPREPARFARAIGDVLDKYVITARLGEGGMSEVLLARDRVLGQLVAIKVMRQAGASDDVLLGEARALTRVRHPNVVQVHGWGRTEAAELYLVLEYVQGQTLHDRLEAANAGMARLDADAAIKIVREIGGALATMHAHGIVHGDIKPDNILLDRTLDRAVLIDFGLALGGDQRGGTPGYSAPEQFSRETPLHATAALDVYALGAVAYSIVTGVPPFVRGQPLVTVAQQRRGAVTPPSQVREGLSSAVDATLLRALAVDPTRRHESMLAFVDSFADALSGGGVPAPVGQRSVDAAPSSRGITFRLVREEVTRLAGAHVEEQTLAALTDEDRAIFLEAAARTGWYPAGPLVAYLHAYGAGDLQKIEDLADAVTVGVLPRVLRTAPVARTPTALLHIAPTLLGRFHDWTKLTAVRTGSQDATLTLRLPPGYAPTMCTWVAGCLRALLRMGSSGATVSQEWCMSHHADACELRVRWN